MRSPTQESPQALRLSRAYPATARQISTVRADLRALLDCCPIADDVLLCASELAANAALHSESGKPGGTFTVRAEVSKGQYVRIEVDDDGGTWITPAIDPDRPHGLDIIGTLTTKWAITETPAGRTVWAQLDWPQT